MHPDEQPLPEAAPSPAAPRLDPASAAGRIAGSRDAEQPVVIAAPLEQALGAAGARSLTGGPELALRRALREALFPSQVAHAIVTLGVAALGASAGTVVRLDPARARLELLASHGYPDALVGDWCCFRLDAQIPAAEAVRRREPVLLDSLVGALARFPALGPLCAETGDVGAAALPLLVGGAPFGALWLTYDAPRHFGDGERRRLGVFAARCARALARVTRITRAGDPWRAH